MLENCLLLAAVLILGMVSPGPDFLLVLKNSCSGDRKYGIGTALGITAGLMVHLTYCALGLGLLVSKSIVLYSIVKYLGAAYLIFIGIRGLLSRRAVEVKVDAARESSVHPGFMKGLREGFLCNVLNPKATVFFVSVISQFFGPETTLVEGAIYCGLILVLNTVYWGLLVFLLQREVVQQGLASARGVLDRLFGAILVALGARVALSD